MGRSGAVVGSRWDREPAPLPLVSSAKDIRCKLGFCTTTTADLRSHPRDRRGNVDLSPAICEPRTRTRGANHGDRCIRRRRVDVLRLGQKRLSEDSGARTGRSRVSHRRRRRSCLERAGTPSSFIWSSASAMGPHWQGTWAKLMFARTLKSSLPKVPRTCARSKTRNRGWRSSGLQRDRAHRLNSHTASGTIGLPATTTRISRWQSL